MTLCEHLLVRNFYLVSMSLCFASNAQGKLYKLLADPQVVPGMPWWIAATQLKIHNDPLFQALFFAIDEFAKEQGITLRDERLNLTKTRII
jgi:hypothetical protein